MTTKLVYLHGFASTGNSEKGRLLMAAFPDFDVVTPTLDPSPERAVAQVEALVTPGTVLVGTSLGGFYAHFFNAVRGIPAVALNPLVDPRDIRGYVGKNPNFHTGEEFEFTDRDWEFLMDLRRRALAPREELSPGPFLVLTAQDDETLDYRKAFDEFTRGHQRIITVPAGGHRFLDKDRLLAELRAFLALPGLFAGA